MMWGVGYSKVYIQTDDDDVEEEAEVAYQHALQKAADNPDREFLTRIYEKFRGGSREAHCITNDKFFHGCLQTLVGTSPT